ncbi:MAG TPA: hypothetical protein VII32_07625 [Thermoanaerobaculia bacterium]
MSFEPAPLDPFEIRVPAIRRLVDRIEPPLDLHVIPFRYRVAADGEVTVVRSSCGAPAFCRPVRRPSAAGTPGRRRRP